VKYVNSMTNTMFHVPHGQTIVGKYPWELSPCHQPSGHTSEEDARAHLKAQAERSVAVTFPWIHCRLDTLEAFECEVSLSSIKVDRRDLTLAIVHDVSALMKAQRELQLLNESLEQRVVDRTKKLEEANAKLSIVNTELEEFTASVSHDLRSPLGTISGQASLISYELGNVVPSKDIASRFERIHAAVRRASDVIDGMLSLARITRQDLLSENVCLTTLIHQTYDELKDTNPGQQSDLICEDGIYVEADPRLMKSLVQNLIGNAWKYSSNRDAIRIEFGRELYKGGYAYYVSDNGAGFKQEYAGKLFQPFKRLHSARISRLSHR